MCSRMQTSSLQIITCIRKKIIFSNPLSPFFFFLLLFPSLFLSPAQTLVAKVKDNQGSLDGNITEDAQANAVIALETTEARAAINRSKVDQATGDGDGGASNSKGK